MFYREAGQFKSRYVDDQAIFPIAQDRWFVIGVEVEALDPQARQAEKDADGRGREHMVLRTGTEWHNRQCRPDEWGSRTRWLSWSDEAPQPVESWRELDYDPRIRPWFTGAIERRRAAGDVDADQLVHWTEPYIFFTTSDVICG